jgi:hypothetical protein
MHDPNTLFSWNKVGFSGIFSKPPDSTAQSRHFRLDSAEIGTMRDPSTPFSWNKVGFSAISKRSAISYCQHRATSTFPFVRKISATGTVLQHVELP